MTAEEVGAFWVLLLLVWMAWPPRRPSLAQRRARWRRLERATALRS